MEHREIFRRLQTIEFAKQVFIILRGFRNRNDDAFRNNVFNLIISENNLGVDIVNRYLCAYAFTNENETDGKSNLRRIYLMSNKVKHLFEFEAQVVTRMVKELQNTEIGEGPDSLESQILITEEEIDVLIIKYIEIIKFGYRDKERWSEFWQALHEGKGAFGLLLLSAEIDNKEYPFFPNYRIAQLLEVELTYEEIIDYLYDFIGVRLLEQNSQT